MRLNLFSMLPTSWQEALRPYAQPARKLTKKPFELIRTGFWGFLLIAIVGVEETGYGLYELFEVKGNFFDWFGAAWFVFIWVLVLATATHHVDLRIFRFLFPYDNNNNKSENKPKEEAEWEPETPEQYLACEAISGISAGIIEELLFRWLMFFVMILSVQSADELYMRLTHGDVGLLKVGFIHVVGPMANYITFGALSDYFVNPANWAIGLSIVITSVVFMAGHQHYVLVFINTGLAAVILTYLTLTYGLVAAMVIHILWNLLVTVIDYVHYCLDRYLGVTTKVLAEADDFHYSPTLGCDG